MGIHLGPTPKEIADDIARRSSKAYTTYEKNGITRYVWTYLASGVFYTGTHTPEIDVLVVGGGGGGASQHSGGGGAGGYRYISGLKPMELCINGGFTTYDTGIPVASTLNWSATRASITGVPGGINGTCLQVTRSSGNDQYVYSDSTHTITSGKYYRLSCWVKSGTSGDEAFVLGMGKVGVSGAGGIRAVYGTTSSTWTKHTLNFKAGEDGNAMTNYEDLWLEKGTSTAGTMLFDEVSLVQTSPVLTINTSYTITIGPGGAGGGASSGQNGTSGTDSAAFTYIVANGGGGAGSYPGVTGLTGGSGGGAGTNDAAGGAGNEGNYNPPEGFDGGNAVAHATGGGGGGGGGSSARGNYGSEASNANSNGEVSNGGGSGGAGTYNDINGIGLYWAAGGGSGAIHPGDGDYPSSAGDGGIGGGGGGGLAKQGSGEEGGAGAAGGSALNAGTAGGVDVSSNATSTGGAAGANTGSGGGGSGSNNSAAGAGGSGIVIVRYPTG